MANIVLFFACLMLGVVFGMTKRFPEASHLALNAFILPISLPAPIFLYIHHIDLHTDIVLSVAMPWILFVVGAAFFYFLSNILHFFKTMTGA